jgi:hypothetical protein
MPTRARRERDAAHRTHHKVQSMHEDWSANRDAVSMLLRVFGYPALQSKAASYSFVHRNSARLDG